MPDTFREELMIFIFFFASKNIHLRPSEGKQKKNPKRRKQLFWGKRTPPLHDQGQLGSLEMSIYFVFLSIGSAFSSTYFSLGKIQAYS